MALGDDEDDRAMSAQAPIGPTSPVWVLLALAYLLVLAAISLWPLGGEADEIGRLCLLCGSRGTADFVANVFVYVPLGYLFGLLAGSRRRAVIWGLAVTVGVELAQLVIPGRYPTVGDVVANGSGLLVGLLLLRHRETWISPTPAAGRRLSWGWAAAVGVVLVLTGLLFSTALPRSTYWGQWTPDLGHMDQYLGRVLSVELDAVSLPPGRLDESDRIRLLLLQGKALEVVAVAGPHPDDLAPIFSIYDGEEREVLVLGSRGVDFVHRARIRADDYRLDRPAHVIRGVFRAAVPGDTVLLRSEALPEGGGHRLQVAGDVYEFAYGIEDGWSLLLYSLDWPTWAHRTAGMLWLVALFAPVAWWAPDMWTVLAAGGGMMVVLALVPAGSALGATSVQAYAAAAAGIAVGLAGRRLRIARSGCRMTRLEAGAA